MRLSWLMELWNTLLNGYQSTSDLNKVYNLRFDNNVIRSIYEEDSTLKYVEFSNSYNYLLNFGLYIDVESLLNCKTSYPVVTAQMVVSYRLQVNNYT